MMRVQENNSRLCVPPIMAIITPFSKKRNHLQIFWMSLPWTSCVFGKSSWAPEVYCKGSTIEARGDLWLWTTVGYQNKRGVHLQMGTIISGREIALWRGALEEKPYFYPSSVFPQSMLCVSTTPSTDHPLLTLSLWRTNHLNFNPQELQEMSKINCGGRPKKAQKCVRYLPQCGTT